MYNTSDFDSKNPKIPADPLMTIEIKDSQSGLEGWVCLHALGRNGASGGIRCMEDVTKNEVVLLARAMTYKFSFLGIAQGGAKAGICVGYSAEREQKEKIIKSAANHLKPLILRSNIWHPWTDMNFYGEELKLFYETLGISYSPNPMYNSSHRTAISAFWALDACLSFFNFDYNNTKITIEGFGSVASYLAPYLVQLGVKVVAVSNFYGTAVNNKGLDIIELAKLRSNSGDTWILQKSNWELIERDKLFEIEADILIPCARVHSIDSIQAENIKTKIVLPISNVPCTDSALKILNDRKIVFVPDFVVNSGGASGHIRSIDDNFGKIHKSMLLRMFKHAESKHLTVRDVAEEVANDNYIKLISNAYTAESKVQKIYKLLKGRAAIPKFLIDIENKKYISTLCAHVDGLYRS